MKSIIYAFSIVAILLLHACNTASTKNENTDEVDYLPSWNEGDAKHSIIGFVNETTNKSGNFYIPEKDRICCFDNDGTLWSEQPAYFQFFYVIDQIKLMAPEHPEWENDPLFKAALDNDLETIMESGVSGLLTLTMVSHSGMTTGQFEKNVKNWINTARHPKTGKLFKEMVYKPMLELLDYFRSNGFKTYIVSGGGIDFMRPWAEEVYNIPPEQIIGSSGKYEFKIIDGIPEIVKLPEIDFINDKEGKPVAIHKFIGKKPVATFGNSDGDLAMLQWTATGEGKRLMGYIHHTDDKREWAYDRESHIGKLDKGLDEANEKGWTVVDMKNDWNTIYPGE